MADTQELNPTRGDSRIRIGHLATDDVNNNVTINNVNTLNKVSD